jgi:AraC family transcriptional activator of pobA
MSADGRQISFEAPTILIVPARCVHGFAWHPESTGRVLTLSEAYLGNLFARETGFRVLFELPDALPLSRGSAEYLSLGEASKRLSREVSWANFGSVAAITACLTTVLVETMRLSNSKLNCAPTGTYADIVARFRNVLESNYHKKIPLPEYARMLGLNVWQLRKACLTVTRKPPSSIVQERKLFEAQRLLLYSNLTISEAAYHLGFDDPAYFSRAFRNLTGQSPRSFRSQH